MEWTLPWTWETRVLCPVPLPLIELELCSTERGYFAAVAWAIVCWVTGWCFSTTMELIGGDTPIEATLVPVLPIFCVRSERAVTRAVIVLPAFCWADVTILVIGSFCEDNILDPDVVADITTGVLPSSLDWEILDRPKWGLKFCSEGGGPAGEWTGERTSCWEEIRGAEAGGCWNVTEGLEPRSSLLDGRSAG